MSTDAVKKLIEEEIKKTDGILRLAPAWVTRTILLPGKRIKIHPSEMYPRGSTMGAVSERWMASTGMVDNGPITMENEGMSFIVCKKSSGYEKVLLKDAIDLCGERILGKRIMQKYGALMSFAKFYDFATPIPHHVHLGEKGAAAVGATPKPEAYYFPVELNAIDYEGRFTYFGLEPGTTKEALKKVLMDWNTKSGDNGILEMTRAYRLKLGTGWNIPAGILHAPGSLVTYEPQRVSDTSLFFQNMIHDKPFERELLVKFVPDEKKYDYDYLVDCLDWEANLDPEFKKNHYHEPIPITSKDGVEENGYHEEWIVYGSDQFSAKKLTVLPGRKVKIKDADAYGFITMQGYGKINGFPLETPAIIGYEQLTCDEYYVTKDRAEQGVTIENISDNANLVMYKHFGPDNPEAAQFIV